MNKKLNDTKKSTEKSLIPLLYESNKQFQGIINYLQKNYNINDELNITSSPVCIDKSRYIKLRQTGLNWYQGYTPTNNLVICSIEFYGYLS